mmetsp:Transcript_37280/g.87170  ORF Transcript_37280/g.87170 Transcript_37280/m.87170 type:complete len:209 (-) Transcript_37280:62-688(-)
MVRPASVRSLSRLTTSCAIFASRPVVGSSTSSTAGSASSSYAIDTRFRCPPESPRESTLPILVSAASVRCSMTTTVSTRAASTPLRAAPKRSISRAVSPASKMSSCGMVLISCRRPPGCATPFSTTLPLVQRPDRRTESKVVFPAPDGPITALRLPGAKDACTSCRISRISLRKAARCTRTAWVTPMASIRTRGGAMVVLIGALEPSC